MGVGFNLLSTQKPCLFLYIVVVYVYVYERVWIRLVRGVGRFYGVITWILGKSFWILYATVEEYGKGSGKVKSLMYRWVRVEPFRLLVCKA